MTETPSWIAVGETVIVREFRSGAHLDDVWKARIERVTKAQFAVEGIEQRFRIQDARTASTGSTWSRKHYEAFPLGNDEGERLLAAHLKRQRIGQARSLADGFSREPSHEKRVALIAALTELGQYDSL